MGECTRDDLTSKRPTALIFSSVWRGFHAGISEVKVEKFQRLEFISSEKEGPLSPNNQSLDSSEPTTGAALHLF